MKTRRKVISPEAIRGTAPQSSKKVVLEIPSEQEVAAFQAMQRGLSNEEAMKKAGYNLPAESSNALAEKIKVKFNDRMLSAYEGVGITPEFIALRQKEIITEGKDSDSLKAIDQVMQTVAGYAPKVVEVNHTTFEQAVIEIGQIVNVNSIKPSDLRALIAEQEIIDVSAS